MEGNIGEKFLFAGKWYQIKPLPKSIYKKDCGPCAANGSSLCGYFQCAEGDRADHRNVIAVECEAPELEMENPALNRTECLRCLNAATELCRDCGIEGERFQAIETDDCRYDPKSRYYDVGGLEVIEIIKAKLTPDQYRGYLIGNVIKYVTRLEHKGQAKRDAEKLQRYVEWLFETFE